MRHLSGDCIALLNRADGLFTDLNVIEANEKEDPTYGVLLQSDYPQDLLGSKDDMEEGEGDEGKGEGGRRKGDSYGARMDAALRRQYGSGGEGGGGGKVASGNEPAIDVSELRWVGE